MWINLNIKNKFLFLLIIFSVMLFSSSCSKTIRLDDLALFSGIGFDNGTDQKLAAAIQVIHHRQLKVQTQGTTEDVTTIVKVSGDNIMDISRNFTLQSGRKGVWSHAKVIIISEDLAKSGIGELLDVLQRDHEIRRRIYLLISKGKAEDILSAESTQLETIQAFNISDMIELNIRNGKVIPVNLLRYNVTTSPNNHNAFITGISLKPESETTEKAKTRLQLDGTAILKKDKLVGWFDQTETRGLLWILGEIKSCIENIEYPKKGNPMAIEICSSNAKVIPVFEDQTIKQIKIQVECTGTIAHSNPNVPLMELGEFEKIEKQVEAQIEREILQSIKKGKEYQTDVFGFNEAVNNKEPKIFKALKEDWDEVFAALEVETDIRLTLKTTGLIKESEE